MNTPNNNNSINQNNNNNSSINSNPGNPGYNNNSNSNSLYLMNKETMSNSYSNYSSSNNTNLLLNEENDFDKRDNIIKLFVGGLNYISFQSDVKSYFDTFGKVVECTLMIDKPSGKSKCYAFITLEDNNKTAKQRIMSRKHEINGKIVDVKLAVEGKEKEEMMDSKKKIFVGGLDPSVTSKDLEDYFMKYGTVKEASVMYDSDRGVSRCFGFVTFEQKETVDTLVKDQNFAIKGKAIEVKPAVPKSLQKPINVISQSGVDLYLNQSKKPYSKFNNKKAFYQNNYNNNKF